MNKQNKKILYIVESFGSGVFSFLVDLINNIDTDYEVVIVYGVREETLPNFKQYFKENVEFIKVENFTRNINPFKDIKALIEIKKIVKKEKPDIVHLHSSKAGILGRLAVNGNKIKMFYNPHGFSFLKMDDSKFKRMIYWWIEKITAMFNRKCTIVGCSNGEYEEALKLNKNSVCINNGINIDKIKKETVSLMKKKVDYENLKICTVGRISYQKNPDMFNQVAERFPNIAFTWIGDGDKKYFLKSPNIKISGWKSRQDVLRILNENDIFILPSLWEGLPISLLEAMYLKKICIVSNVIGNRDVIIDGNNGFISNSCKEYCGKIEYIKNNPSIIGKIIKKAFDDVNEKFCTDRMCSEYKKIYG